MTETTEQMDERRARAIFAGVFFESWESAPPRVKKSCLRDASAIRASDEAAGMVLVPRAPLMLATAITDVIETNYTGEAWRDVEIQPDRYREGWIAGRDAAAQRMQDHGLGTYAAGIANMDPPE